jgi:hypothetical protein
MDAKEKPVMGATLRPGSGNSEPKAPRDRPESGNIQDITTHPGCGGLWRESDSQST